MTISGRRQHDTRHLACALFTFLVFVHELARDPGKFVPAFIVLSMLGYIGFECIRAFRRRRPDDHDQEPQGTNSDGR